MTLYLTTGYKVFKGQKTSPDVLAALLEGLETNGIDTHAKVLTGYVPSAEALQVIETHVQKMLEARSETVYILDRKLIPTTWLTGSGHGRCRPGTVRFTRGRTSLYENAQTGYNHYAQSI
jgi:hypothetical protein